MTFIFLDGLPTEFHLLNASPRINETLDFPVVKNMRVSAQEFFYQRIHDFREVEQAAFTENPTGAVLELGAMAHMVGLYAPDDIEKWPAIDLEDPVYQKDLASLADQFSKITPMNMQHEEEDEHGDHEHDEDDGE